jgi:acyl-coenzyme A synthetase/AMP-(fatty) acid ligase
MAAFSRGTPLLGIGKPDAETVLSLFERYRPTIIEAHPNAFMGWEELVDHPSQPFASARVFFNTFDAIHPRTVRTMLDASQRMMPVWLQSYGMTETQVVTLRMQTRRSVRKQAGRDSRSVGWPVPGVMVRIADPKTGRRQTSQSEPGMIQVRTRAQALSFVATPDKFSQRRHGKWFDTGDWGRRGRLRQVEVLDRVADRIDGVESCLWLEDMLIQRIPDAEEVVVVPDGQGRPVPVICMRDGKPLTQDVWRLAAEGLTGLQDPVQLDANELARTATVKPRRYLLTEKIKNGDLAGLEAISPEVVLREGA